MLNGVGYFFKANHLTKFLVATHSTMSYLNVYCDDKKLHIICKRTRVFVLFLYMATPKCA